MHDFQNDLSFRIILVNEFYHTEMNCFEIASFPCQFGLKM